MTVTTPVRHQPARNQLARDLSSQTATRAVTDAPDVTRMGPAQPLVPAGARGMRPPTTVTRRGFRNHAVMFVKLEPSPVGVRSGLRVFPVHRGSLRILART